MYDYIIITPMMFVDVRKVLRNELRSRLCTIQYDEFKSNEYSAQPKKKDSKKKITTIMYNLYAHKKYLPTQRAVTPGIDKRYPGVC